MKILDFGSMNLDFVYSVDHIVSPGETESSAGMNTYLGGKGMNQAAALAKAGAQVWLAGRIGEDGQPFLDACAELGIHDELIEKIDGRSGHAIIQLDKTAQNSILLYGGANRRMDKAFIDRVLSSFSAGDLLVVQNEISLLPYLVDSAFERGMIIALNPSPYDCEMEKVDLSRIGLFLLNEVEGGQLTGKTDPDDILAALLARFPHAAVVLTLGRDGAIYADRSTRFDQPVFPVKAVDTTAAGDTFTGYFLAGLAQDIPIPRRMARCAMASALAVSRPGALPSIPFAHEVEQALDKR